MNNKDNYVKNAKRNSYVASSLAACINSESSLEDKILKYNNILAKTNLQSLTLCAGLPEVNLTEAKEILDYLIILQAEVAQQKGSPSTNLKC